MQQHIPTIDTAAELDAARMEDAFERHYDCHWGDPTMRSERLAWLAAWRAAVASTVQPAPSKPVAHMWRDRATGADYIVREDGDPSPAWSYVGPLIFGETVEGH